MGGATKPAQARSLSQLFCLNNQSASLDGQRKWQPYADMQERIARELHRPDLTNEIKDAIKTAIRFYSSQRFVWNEYQWSFSTEPGVK